MKIQSIYMSTVLLVLVSLLDVSAAFAVSTYSVGVRFGPGRHHHVATLPALPSHLQDSFDHCNIIPVVALASGVLIAPDAVFAASTGTGSAVVANALVAYAHYASLLVALGCVVYERATIEAGMSYEKEKTLVVVESIYGVSALCLFASGYYRVVEFGKGWDFYSHEPLFWLKLSLAGIVAGLSAFPTITVLKRHLFMAPDAPSPPPLSDKLAARLTTILNAEITAFLSIPLLATFMARGVTYWNDFFWPLGAGAVVVTLSGSVYYYARQAVTWTEADEYQLKS